MQISRVHIKNILGIEALDIELRLPINVFVGPNEAGKSSIRDAILWCFTGSTRGLKTHKEQAALIRNGNSFGEVAVTRADGHVYSRRKTPKSPATDSGFEIEPEFPISAELLMDPASFLALSENIRRPMLFALIPGMNPSAKKIYDRLAPTIEEVLGIPHPLWGEVKGMTELAEKEGFKAAETEAIARRREAKRLRDDLETTDPIDSTIVGGIAYDLPKVNVELVKEGMAARQAQRDELIRAKAVDDAVFNIAEVKVKRLERELQTARGNPAPALPEGDPAEWEKTLERARTELQQGIDSLEAMTEGEPAQEFPKFCPAFKVEITCPAAGTVAIKGTRPENTDPEEIEEAQVLLGKIKDEIARLEENCDLAKKHKDYQDKVSRLETELEAARGELKAAEPVNREPEIAELDELMEGDRLLMVAVKDYQDELVKVAADRGRLEEVEKEIKFYDSLAKEFAPAGLPSRLIAEALEPVNDLLSHAASYLFPERPLCLTPELGIDLGGSPYVTLSKSTKFRVGVAFQYVLARLSGARLLMIDEADILDLVNREALLDFLLEVQEDFDTIMVFGTATDIEIAPRESFQMWWVAEGKASTLEFKEENA